MSFTAEEWSALIAALAAIIALYSIYAESKRSRFSQGVELLLRLDEEFSRLLREKRASASLYLAGKPTFEDGLDESLRDVLNFFEKVGYLHRRGALDAEMVWQTFSTWIIPYCAASNSYREQAIKKDKNYYSELGLLYKKIISIEKKKAGQGSIDQITSETALRKFCDRECGPVSGHLPQEASGFSGSRRTCRGSVWRPGAGRAPRARSAPRHSP